MVEQLEECIAMFEEKFSMSVSYPETKKLFELRKDSKQFIESKG